MKSFLPAILLCVTIFAHGQNTITWSAGTNIASNSYGNLHPRIVTDGSGNPVVIWGRMSDESVFISRWNGSVFTTPVKINPSWLTIATQTWMGPDIAARGDTMYVVMKQTPESDANSHVYIASSFDGGITFSDPVQVDFIADSLSRFPTVTIDASGNPVVGFMKFNSSFLESRWAVTTSSDYGNTFSTDVKASGWSGGGSTVCDCCPGSITSSGNTIAILYRDNLSNIRDMWAGISNDGGSSFTGGIGVDQGNWMLMACPASGPDGAIIGDTLYTTYMSGTSGTDLVYLSKSSLSSMIGSAGTELTGMIMGLTSQNYPRIASAGNALAVVWTQNVSGTNQLMLRFTNNVTNGLPSTPDTVDLSNITNTDVALTDGNIFVVWEDDGSGTVKYRKGTFSPATGIEENNSQNLFPIFPNPANNQLLIKNCGTTNHNEIEVRNFLGEEVIQKIISQTNNHTIDVSQLPDGVYFLKIFSGESSSIQKVVINH